VGTNSFDGLEQRLVFRQKTTAEGRRMSRRRSPNPTKAISITLPESLLRRLDNYLSYSSSRSAYIADALKKKLDEQKGFSFDDIETEALVRYLLERDIPNNIDTALRTYWSMITSSNLSEEL